jgi:CRISPR-associated protein Csb2
MDLIIQQSFPLGRFHATPWRVNPFDDPFGEWPPSPWRFVRAVVARWYQWSRESREIPDLTQLDELVHALCDSSYSFHLPVQALRGTPIRQYHPVEFRWEPPGKTKGKGPNKKPISQLRMYGTSLVQDNYWCVPCDESGTIWWFVEGSRWTVQLLEALDHCLERLIYFGRAETFTSIRRVSGPAPAPNCGSHERPRSANSVRVLVPERDASRADVERVTDDPLLAANIPPGARTLYADVPLNPTRHDAPVPFPERSDCRLMQVAIGWNVPPEPRSAARLTGRYRSAVLRELILIKTQGRHGTWTAAPEPVKLAVMDMFGKDAQGNPLKDHSHAEFFAWWQDRLPTRLIVWRGARPFDPDEQAAILKAASRELSWAAAGPDADAWKIRLIPLDAAVPPPSGFDQTYATIWESMTPYVPPRHRLRGGKPRPSESLEIQIRRELTLRGVAFGDLVEVEEIGTAIWVAVHVPRRDMLRRDSLGDRLGHRLRLKFREPIAGPLRLGHSSSFGVGLFSPSA